jgi:hypothetical protein
MKDTRQWRKSSYSGSGGNCVEVGTGDTGTVGIRDSKTPGPELAVGHNAWSEFTAAIKRGEFTLR